MSNKKVGLALGGGAVLGAAHIGVLKAMEEKGYEVTHITGTSIGAFIWIVHDTFIKKPLNGCKFGSSGL